MKPPIRDKEYLNESEATAYIGIGKSTLYKYRAMGLEVIKIGGRTFYSKELIRKFMQRFTIGGEQ